MDNISLGKLGEQIASSYLSSHGYKVIEMNFQKRWGEIDIVATDPSAGSGQEVLVFIEVKTRMEGDFISPEESITSWKLKTLVKSANFYKSSHPNTPSAMRIDFVGIVLGSDLKPKKINLIKNIAS